MTLEFKRSRVFAATRFDRSPARTIIATAVVLPLNRFQLSLLRWSSELHASPAAVPAWPSNAPWSSNEGSGSPNPASSPGGPTGGVTPVATRGVKPPTSVASLESRAFLLILKCSVLEKLPDLGGRIIIITSFLGERLKSRRQRRQRCSSSGADSWLTESDAGLSGPAGEKLKGRRRCPATAPWRGTRTRFGSSSTASQLLLSRGSSGRFDRSPARAIAATRASEKSKTTSTAL